MCGIIVLLAISSWKTTGLFKVSRLFLDNGIDRFGKLYSFFCSKNNRVTWYREVAPSDFMMRMDVSIPPSQIDNLGMVNKAFSKEYLQHPFVVPKASPLAAIKFDTVHCKTVKFLFLGTIAERASSSPFQFGTIRLLHQARLFSFSVDADMEFKVHQVDEFTASLSPFSGNNQHPRLFSLPDSWPCW